MADFDALKRSLQELWRFAVEEGIVIGGRCTLLKLTGKVDAVKPSLQALRGAGTGPASSLLADL